MSTPKTQQHGEGNSEKCVSRYVFKDYFLYHVCNLFVSIYMCVLGEVWCSWRPEGILDSGNWSYWRKGFTMWMSGTESKSSAKAMTAFN